MHHIIIASPQSFKAAFSSRKAKLTIHRIMSRSSNHLRRILNVFLLLMMLINSQQGTIVHAEALQDRSTIGKENKIPQVDESSKGGMSRVV